MILRLQGSLQSRCVSFELGWPRAYVHVVSWLSFCQALIVYGCNIGRQLLVASKKQGGIKITLARLFSLHFRKKLVSFILKNTLNRFYKIWGCILYRIRPNMLFNSWLDPFLTVIVLLLQLLNSVAVMTLPNNFPE